MHRGYLALWRKFQDHEFWREKREFSKAEAWIDILWEAQHDPNPRQVVFGMRILTCHYGECLKSTRTWASRWNWSEVKVRRFLKLLESMTQICLKSESITTRITVLNYEQYDPKRRAVDAEATHDRSTDKNVKNVKNKTSSRRSDPGVPVDQILNLYHEILPELPKVKIFTEARKAQIRERWKETDKTSDLEWWRRLFKYVRKCPHLMGQNDRQWRADLEWITKLSNFTKIIEGKYER